MKRLIQGSIPKAVAFSAILVLGVWSAARSSNPWPVLIIVVATILYLPFRLRRNFAAAGNSETAVVVHGLSRRDALKRIGIGTAAVAAPVAGLPALINQLPASAGPSSEEIAAATGPSGRIRQWGMIIDLRKCDGCQSQGTAPQCTLACIEGHLAPDPMQWIEVYEHDLEGGGTQFLPTPCQQCQSPPCVNVCPVGATFSNPEGIVLIDQQRCIGCRMCMAACPYDRRFFNWGDAPVPPEALLANYSIETQVNAPKGTVMKCDFCPDMARAGALPMCVAGCPNDAIYYGDLEEDIATNGSEVISFENFMAENNSYRQKEELGTQPRVHYIPGHGELIGRDKDTKGRMATRWPWIERAKGSVTWSR